MILLPKGLRGHFALTFQWKLNKLLRVLLTSMRSPMSIMEKKTISFIRLLLRYFQNLKDGTGLRSEEHTSELQSRGHLVCRLLLEKKKQTDKIQTTRTLCT